METMGTLVKNLDKGFFAEAKNAKVDTVTLLASKARDAGVGIEGAAWEQRKEAYFRRFKLHGEERFGAKAQAVAKFARDTYALEKAYAEFGVKTRGRDSDTVAKALATSTSGVLFPVFIDSQVVAGILNVSLVDQLIAAERGINAHVADHTTLNESAADRSTTESGELARPTVVTVKTADQSIKLRKHSAELRVSYEVLRMMPLNIVSIFMQRLGAQIGINETDDLLDVAILGDGNTGSAVVDTDAEATGVLDYDELIRLFLAFPNGYEMRHAVINDTQIRTVLNMSQFQNPLSGFNFQATGKLVNPMGAQFHRWTSTGSSAFSTDRIVAVDDRYAFVQYTEGGTLTENAREISEQFEKIVVSKWTGFGKLDYNATQVLDITT